jgi:hypothetical protein
LFSVQIMTNIRSVMKSNTKIYAAMLVAATLTSASELASSDEGKAKNSSAAEQKSETRVKDKKETKTSAEAKKNEGTKKRFVDRDGDGIQDGMEHRFRRRKGFGAKSKWRGEGRQLKRAGKGHKQNGKPNGR